MTECGRESYKRPFDLGVVALLAVALLPLWVALAIAVPQHAVPGAGQSLPHARLRQFRRARAPVHRVPL